MLRRLKIGFASVLVFIALSWGVYELCRLLMFGETYIRGGSYITFASDPITFVISVLLNFACLAVIVWVIATQLPKRWREAASSSAKETPDTKP
jgi:hypothetical protein